MESTSEASTSSIPLKSPAHNPEEKRKKKKGKSRKSDADLTSPSKNLRSSQENDEPKPAKPTVCQPTSAFETVYPVIDLPIPPIWIGNPYAAFADLMDTLVMRYVPQLSGVLITHNPTQFLKESAILDSDSAFSVAPIGFECVVWRPKVGMTLEGRISLSSPSHVSLLLYGTFNASISASHLPSNDWEFIFDEEVEPLESSDSNESVSDRSLGYWKRIGGDERLGGADGSLSFTVISMTVANHMLSLHGSLLENPFAVPTPETELKGDSAKAQTQGASTDDGASSRTNTVVQVSTRRVRWVDQGVEDSDSEDEATATTRSMAQVPPAVQPKERKSSKRKQRKTKEGNTSGSDSEASSERMEKKKKRKTK
ncbi:hypothetical protein IE53DRAFT_410450 [Violaceomyces palustris]|uniref:Uncharacterized protein n=1 Tax=Violaceomyces palustris TaxID=1673888 RepID=A0ACD0NYX1_9BASI|nr:hypothetical protein IE53DRAFT_410450 [Violaceomyces palustris]